jgi:hypothetical protein
MLLATSLLALSLIGGPKTSCAAPTQTGIFRITALNKDSTNAKIGMILLENVDNCLEASIITEDAGPALIDNLKLTDDVLTGQVRLPTGTASVTIRFAATTIAGSIVEGKHQWSLSGRRTSGGDTRVAAREP